MDVYYIPHDGKEGSQFDLPAIKKEPFSTMDSYKDYASSTGDIVSCTSYQFENHTQHESSLPPTDHSLQNGNHNQTKTINAIEIARLLKIPADAQMWSENDTKIWMNWLSKEANLPCLSDCMAPDGKQLCDASELELMFLTGSPENGSEVMKQLNIWKTAYQSSKQCKASGTSSKVPSTVTTLKDDLSNNKSYTNRLLPPNPITWCNPSPLPNVGMMNSGSNTMQDPMTEQLYSNMINSFSQPANFNELSQLIPHFNILHKNYAHADSSNQTQINKCIDQMAYNYSAFLQAEVKSAMRHGSVGTSSEASEISPTANLTAGGSVSKPNTLLKRKSKHPIHLWEFLKQLLLEGRDGIRWIDQGQGIFKIYNSQQIAKYWGERKNRPAMNYDKLSRSIRQYYKKGIIRKTTQGKRLVYQFCPAYR